MKLHSRILAIAIILITVVFGAFVAFSSSKTATALRNGIQLSLEEDFKIKDSLGKVFFVDAEDDSQAASSNAVVNSYILPMDATWEKIDKNIEFYPQGYQSVFAVLDGYIEEISDESVKIKHTNGSLSEYFACRPLCKVGQNVCAGETIGYANEKMVFCFSQNGENIDLSDYFK